jgi:hypothetical protein
MHPVERNAKREKAVARRQDRGPNKGCGKVWVKEELDIMIRLEKSLEDHPHIAMQMKDHLPEKSLKQIRDKRRQPTFKTLVTQYKATQRNSATPEPNDTICPDSDSETESRLGYTRRHISETEDEDISDQGHNSRQTNLERPAGSGPPPTLMDANDYVLQASTPPVQENGATKDHGNTIMTEQEWRTDIMIQTLK